QARVRGGNGADRLRPAGRRPRQADHNRGGAWRAARDGVGAVTWRRPHESLTGLLVLGFAGLLAGLLLTAVLGVVWLGQMRRDLEHELGSLEQSSEMGNGLITSAFDEIRAAERYLSATNLDAEQAFQQAGDYGLGLDRGCGRRPCVTDV